jgi:hypothetical protein
MPRALSKGDPTTPGRCGAPDVTAFDRDAPRPHEARNFLLMVSYQVVMRTGWIFKTESVIMPAVLDVLSGNSDFLRGFLPFLNRFGQSVPPLMMARRVKVLPKKKHAFIATTTSMALIFAGLTAIFVIPGVAKHPLTPWLYLVLYALFFMAIGVNHLAYNTLQGKLIRVTRRGRLLMIADTLGAASAIVCALGLLPLWLGDDYARFDLVFGFSTALFSLATITAWLLKEQRDDHQEPRRWIWTPFVVAWQTLRDDANFRRLGLVAALFSCSLLLFPHYQALAGRKPLEMGFSYLVWFLVAQNAGTAVFSLITGPIADRTGNRLPLRLLTLAICAAPQIALLLDTWAERDTGSRAYCRVAYFAVFLLVGMTPVAQKTFNNYTLEISRPEDHARYLSTLSLCMSAPIFAAPLVGWLIGRLGFPAVYHGVTALLLAGALVSATLVEPRHKLKSTDVMPAEDTL